MTLRSSTRALTTLTLLFGLASPVRAIVTRHDRDDRAFLELARQYPSTAKLRPASRPNGPGDTGTLIAREWVLTAAHVAAGLKAGDVVEIAGATHAIAAIVRHPEWQTNADIRVDIALVRLTEPVTATEPVRIYDRDDEAGMIATFVGRGGNGTGLTGPSAEDRQLRAATNRVERADGSLLQFRFDAPGDPGVTDLEGISGPGDSGGPAYVDLAGVRYVIGVSSGQDSRPAGRKVGHYAVLEYYPRVSHFRAWIAETMAAEL